MYLHKLPSGTQPFYPPNFRLFSPKSAFYYPSFPKISSAALAITVPGP